MKTIKRVQQHTSVASLWARWESDEKTFMGESHTFIGHVYGYRVGGGTKYLFIDFLDGSTVRDLKCICDKTKETDGYFDELFAKISRGTGIKLTGIITASPPKASQPFELIVTKYQIIGLVQDPATYILALKQQVSQELLRTQYPHLRDQTKTGTAITLIKKTAYQSYDDAMAAMGIGRIDYVGFTKSDCEGGADQFRIMGTDPEKLPKDKSGQPDYTKDFFPFPVYLTCSAQLELEYAALAAGAVHTWTRASRAEPSTGPRHLATFDMDEWEIVCEALEEDMLVAEQVIKAVLEAVLSKHMPELAFLATTYGADYQSTDLIARLTKYLKTEKWPTISHEEAVLRMRDDATQGLVQFTELPTVDGDLSKEHERYITEVMFGGSPVFVKWFPSDIKSFYMPVVEQDPGTSGISHADCFDLLFPIIGEVVGGSMRETSYEKLRAVMQKRGMDEEPLKQYLDIRKDGSLPHGGAGIGFARLLMTLTGILQIKDMVEMPRSYDCFA
jgi:asparaginyl-tRNA synthetase